MKAIRAQVTAAEREDDRKTTHLWTPQGHLVSERFVETQQRGGNFPTILTLPCLMLWGP